MENKKSSINNIQRCFVGTLAIYIITYYAVVGGERLSLGFDYILHTDSAMLVSRNIDNLKELLITRKDNYPLWHIIVKFFYSFLGVEAYEAAAIATAVFNCITYWGVNYIWIKYKGNTNLEVNTWLWTIFLMVMGPIRLPSITFQYYLGQGTGNPWHNPTNIAVKGFAVLAFALICYLLKTEICKKKHYIVLAILLAISALAKPVFLQGIIPGLGVYFILQILLGGKIAWKENMIRFLKIAVCFFPSVMILFIQFLILFLSNQDPSGVSLSFGWGEVLYHWTPSLFKSFLLAFAFPISVLVIDFKNIIKCKEYQLALCYELCAWLESVVIYETGQRKMHGNWLWGSYISMFVLWVISLIKLWDYIHAADGSIRKRVSIVLALSLLFAQVLCGIGYYWMAVVNNASFLYLR